MPALPPTLVVLDTETTGLEPELGHEIIELAAQKVVGRDVVGEFAALVTPTRPVPPDAAAVHGITPELLAAEGKPASEVFPAFLAFLGDAGIVAHNAAFDIAFLNRHLALLGLPALTNSVLDTLELAKRYLILPSYSLKNVAAYLHVVQPSAHRALVDVETTREVFFRLAERAKGTTRRS